MKDYEEILIAGEIEIVNQQFINMLFDLKFPKRTTAKSLREAVDKFYKKMCAFYEPKVLEGSTITDKIIGMHVDNLMHGIMKQALDDYYSAAKVIIDEASNGRLSTSKFFACMMILVNDRKAMAVIDAVRM